MCNKRLASFPYWWSIQNAESIRVSGPRKRSCCFYRRKAAFRYKSTEFKYSSVKEKKVKRFTRDKRLHYEKKKREIFSYLFDVSLKKKRRRRSRWYRDRHSFYGLVRPALHGSGAGRRDKRLFLSFLFIRELKEIPINQYRHLTESLFFFKILSLPKNSRCCVFHLISTFGRCAFKEKQKFVRKWWWWWWSQPDTQRSKTH